MNVLFLVAILFVSGPPQHKLEMAATPLSVHGETMVQVATKPPNHTANMNRILFAPPAPKASIDLSRYTDLVPYGTELVQLNDLYQRYRADKRWQNGVGLTITFGHQRQRLILGLGPVQFTFGSQNDPPIR